MSRTLDEDGTCPRCGGTGCVACSARYLPASDRAFAGWWTGRYYEGPPDPSRQWRRLLRTLRVAFWRNPKRGFLTLCLMGLSYIPIRLAVEWIN